MNQERTQALLKTFAAFFFGMPFAVVTLVVSYSTTAYNTSSIPVVLHNWPLPISIASLAIAFGVLRTILESRSMPTFVLGLCLAGTGLVASSVAAGTWLHPDYFSAAFQYVLIIPTLFLLFSWNSNQDDMAKNTLRSLGIAGLVITGFFVEWIMLMGYAIATRSEPRALESIIYNVYNLMLALFLFIISRGVERKSRCIMYIHDTSVRIDARDVTTLFGPDELQLLKAFVQSRDRTIHCREPDFNDKHVMELKKLLEILGIGTITSPNSKDQVVAESWKLLVFENIQIRSV